MTKISASKFNVGGAVYFCQLISHLVSDRTEQGQKMAIQELSRICSGFVVKRVVLYLSLKTCLTLDRILL